MIRSSCIARASVTVLLLAACSTPKDTPVSTSGPPSEASPAPTTPSPTTPGTPTPSSPDAGTDGGVTNVPPDPGPPAIRYIGRFDERDAAGPKCGWPGCRIIANFDGTGVSAKLSEQAFDCGPSEWDVAIDGQWMPKLVMKSGANDYALADGLPAGHHQVELYRRSEAQCGVTQFMGYDFKGGTLLPPPLHKERKIEIIGDSDVSGFGYEGAITKSCEPGPVWAAHLENYRMAWGERLTQKLNAEMNSVVFSGKGFYYNIWRPDLDTIGVLYPRANPVDDKSFFDLTKFTPDVVVVSIGGNDYNIGLPEDFGAAPLDKFTGAARDMTTMLRKNYPQAHIFLMAYAVLTDEYPPGRGRRTNVETALKTITAEHEAAGDHRVYFVAPSQAVESELTACDGHGGPEYHERVAVYMAEQIMAKTGWK